MVLKSAVSTASDAPLKGALAAARRGEILVRAAFDIAAEEAVA